MTLMEYRHVVNVAHGTIHYNKFVLHYMVNKIADQIINYISASALFFFIPKSYVNYAFATLLISFVYCTNQWIVPQFLNLRPKMAKSIVYVITLITNRNHAFHCLN